MAPCRILLLSFYVINCVAHEDYSPHQISQNAMWNATYTDKLKQDILLGYDKFARPTQHYNKTTVNLGLSLQYFEIDNFKSTFNAIVWLNLQWFDEKLQWNSSQYGGLKTVHFANHEIWQPDIVLYNGANGAPSSNHLLGTHFIGYHSGKVLWVPPTHLIAFCYLNLRYWPFDTQSCSLKLGSWTYDGNEIDVQVNRSADFSNFIRNSEWQIISTNKSRRETVYPCCDEPYIDATFAFDLKRRSSPYSAIIITPTLAIIFLNLVSFWLPPQYRVKLIINACALIIISIFMLYFAQQIPRMGSDTALIVLFYRDCMCAICFSTLEAIVVICISRMKHKSGLPWYIKRPLIGRLGTWLGLSNLIRTVMATQTTNEEVPNDQITDFEIQSNYDPDFNKSELFKRNQEEWKLLAIAIDRVSFLFYIILYHVLCYLMVES